MNDRYLVILGHFGHMGGAERQAIHLIKYLRETKQLPVAVLGYTGEGMLSVILRELGCELHQFPFDYKLKGLAKMKQLGRLTMFIRREIRPTVILPFVSVHSKVPCAIWKWTGARYCWWNQQDEGRRMFKSDFERRALNNAVHITSNSRAGADFLSESFSIPLDRIIVYNNGTVVPDASSLKPMWREKLGLRPDQLLVSMLANITVFKEHGVLLNAWKQVIEAMPDNPPTLVLAGHQKEKIHALTMKALAFDLGLGASVRFIGPIDATKELLAESDMVVHSSIKEGCPNAVCEAMALGRAVVGTDIPGMRQALGEADADFVYAPPHDADTLARKLIYLLQNPDKRNEIGDRNLQRIKQDFSIDGMNEFLFGLTQNPQAQPASAT